MFHKVQKELVMVYAQMKFVADKMDMALQQQAKLPKIVDLMMRCSKSFAALPVGKL